jgi:hypothetical protein
MAKDRRSKDQKRKEKLAKKARDKRAAESLACTGNKFKTDELVPLWMTTETAIYEAYVITDRTLLDRTVHAALVTLIKQMRAGTLPPPDDSDTLTFEEGGEEELVVANIRRHWEDHFEVNWRPSKTERIGVLRTILGSIETMRSPGPQSQSYMRHIAGFLTKQLGVSVKKVTPDMQFIPEPDEDELVLLGRSWADSDDLDAKSDFFELAGELLNRGEAKRVIDAVHQLIGEQADVSSPAFEELSELSRQARRTLLTSSN